MISSDGLSQMYAPKKQSQAPHKGGVSAWHPGDPTTAPQAPHDSGFSVSVNPHAVTSTPPQTPPQAPTDYPRFDANEPQIPRSFAFKLMRWMQYGQGIIHALDRSSRPIPEGKTAELPLEQEMTDAVLEHVTFDDDTTPIEEVVSKTKNRWKQLGKAPVDHMILPMIKIASQFMGYKTKDIEELTIDQLEKMIAPSRGQGSTQDQPQAAQENVTDTTHDASNYADFVMQHYSVDRNQADSMIADAVKSAKNGPNPPEIRKITHGAETAIGVTIPVQGGTALSFNPEDVHDKLETYLKQSHPNLKGM